VTTFLSIILIAFNKSWYNYRQINSQGPGQQKQNQRQQESVIQQDHRKVPNQIPISIKLRRQYFRRGAAQSQHQSIVPVQSNARRIQIRLGRQAIWRQEAWRPGPHQQNDRGLEEQQEGLRTLFPARQRRPRPSWGRRLRPGKMSSGLSSSERRRWGGSWPS